MKKNNIKYRLTAGIMTAAMVLTLAASNITSFVSRAESAASVTASTANVRQEANSSSTIVGSVVKNDKISIIGQTTGADGKTWYQIYVNASSLGFIRSDLVTITDGSTPPALSSSSGETASTDTATSNVSTDGMRNVNPVEGTVSGGQSVRVRSDATTSSDIVTTAQNGIAVTVSGVKTASDGKDWYYVTFADGGNVVNGFIRSDFLTLSGELTDVIAEEPEQPAEEGEVGPVESESSIEIKAYETQLQGENWFLLDNLNGVQYNIKDLFDNVSTNYNLYTQQEKKAKTYRTVCIFLMILLIAAIAGLGYIFMKWRDSVDSIAFREAENNRKTRPSAGGLKDRLLNKAAKNGPTATTGRPMGGGQKKPAEGQKKPAGTGNQSQVRPGQNRPGMPANGQGRPGMPANGQNRPGMPGNGQGRPGMPANGQGRPGMPANGQGRPGMPANGQGRPGMSANGQNRPGMNENGARPAAPSGSVNQTGAPMPGRAANPQPMGNPSANEGAKNPAADSAPKKQWKSRNFADDDDEFEYCFPNWDDDEK